MQKHGPEVNQDRIETETIHRGVKFKICLKRDDIQRSGHVKRMDRTRALGGELESKFKCKKTCGMTMNKMV
jgi:hypothetical protein